MCALPLALSVTHTSPLGSLPPLCPHLLLFLTSPRAPLSPTPPPLRSSVKNSVKGKSERIGRMLQMHANERTEVKEARAGDIVAIVGLKVQPTDAEPFSYRSLTSRVSLPTPPAPGCRTSA